ncbi:MAG: OmpA family protein [Kofleriaceae bacterium]|nr:OmpA family protein [Kofleriaceae bacterium]MCL4226848.1 OmpA family protein [Myxococcales bacterium]
MRWLPALGVVAVTLGLAGSSAVAQSTVVYTPDFDPDRFVLTADPDSIGLTEGARTMARGEYALGLALRLGGPPLSICVQDHATGQCRVEGDLVTGRMGADLVAAFGFGRVTAHAQLPVVLYQGSDFGPSMDGSSLSATAVGDLRLGGKLGITRFGDAALAWDLTFSLPTGGGDNFVGDRGTVVENRALLDWRRGRLGLAGGLGYAFRSHAGQVGGLYVDDEVLWSAAGQYQVRPALDVGLALFGRIGVQSDPDPVMAISDIGWEERPAEVLASAVHRLSPTLSIEGGAGMALDSGYGAPFRLLAAVRWTERKAAAPAPRPEPEPEPEPAPEPEPEPAAPVDTDGDGLTDDVDRCPTEPEDLDGFQDDDGCPDPDNDGDGILDVDDACPLEAEVINGVDDSDGCPDEALATVTGGQVVILEMIHFDTNRARIKRESYPVLDAVVAVLKSQDQLRIRVEGHTDDRGGDAWNLKLSQQRADSVRAYLIDKGIAADRLETAGFGATRRRIEGTSESDRQTNRRVEFVIIE